MGLLSVLIWLPICSGLLILLFGDRTVGGRILRLAQWLALVVSFAAFLIGLLLYSRFDITTPSMQFVERVPWISTFQIEYFLRQELSKISKFVIFK